MVRITDVNQKFAGAEPKFSTTLEASEFTQTLNWYAQNKVKKDSQKYAQTFFKKKHKVDISGALKMEPSTFGFLCRIISNGGTLPAEHKTWFEEKEKELLQKAKNVVVIVDDTPSNVINIQERIKQKASECVGELEGQIDEMILSDFQVIPEPYGIMHTMGIKSPHASKINAYFEKEKKRYSEVLTTTDKLLKEGYSNFNKTEIKKIITYCDRVIAAGKKIQGDSRKTRKPRRKKVD